MSQENDLTNQLMEKITLIEGIDINAGLKYAGNNQETYLFVLKSFLKHSNPYIEEFDRLLKEEAWGDYNIRAHTFKGLLATLGLKKLPEQAFRLETASKAGHDNFSPDVCRAETAAFLAEVSQFRDILSGVLQATPKNEKPKGDAQFFKEQLRLLEHACKEYSFEDLQAIVVILEQYDWGAEVQKEVTQICDFIVSYDYDKVLEIIKNFDLS